MAVMQQHSTVVGVFDAAARAEKAIRELRDAGFPAGQIGFAMRDPGAAGPALAQTPAFGAAAGGVTGALTGGALGGLLGTAASFVVPGVGVLIGAGLLSAYLGGLAGALTGMGLSQEQARSYHREVEAGRAIVTVEADGRYSEALAILADNGARDVTREDR